MRAGEAFETNVPLPCYRRNYFPPQISANVDGLDFLRTVSVSRLLFPGHIRRLLPIPLPFPPLRMPPDIGIAR